MCRRANDWDCSMHGCFALLVSTKRLHHITRANWNLRPVSISSLLLVYLKKKNPAKTAKRLAHFKGINLMGLVISLGIALENLWKIKWTNRIMATADDKGRDKYRTERNVQLLNLLIRARNEVLCATRRKLFEARGGVSTRCSDVFSWQFVGFSTFSLFRISLRKKIRFLVSRTLNFLEN